MNLLNSIYYTTNKNRKNVYIREVCYVSVITHPSWEVLF
jgi:hypothetical protein